MANNCKVLNYHLYQLAYLHLWKSMSLVGYPLVLCPRAMENHHQPTGMVMASRLAQLHPLWLGPSWIFGQDLNLLAILGLGQKTCGWFLWPTGAQYRVEKSCRHITNYDVDGFSHI